MKNTDQAPKQHGERWTAESLLCLEPKNSPGTIKTITSGIRFQTLEMLASRSGLPIDGLIDALGLHSAKLTRRKAQEKLTSAETDRLLSLANTLACGINLFSGNKEAAATWFMKPSPALGNITPLQMARTNTGRRAVQNLIGQLAHGIFS